MGQQILYNEAISVLFYTFLFNSLHKCNRAEVDAICLFSLSVYQRIREIRQKKKKHFSKQFDHKYLLARLYLVC